jgi:Na+/melibiose symporter-like transporter
LILFWVLLRLPETIHLNPHNSDDTKKISLFVLAKNMMINKKTLSSILIIAACNGIVFSYYSDGSFYFTKLLGMSETQYSLTFLLILVANFVGGNVSKKLQHILKPKTILHYSIYCAFLGLILFILQIFINEFILKIPYLEWLLFFDLFITFLGIAMVNPNAFFLGLEDYRHCPGRATSIFGFIYCINGATYVFLMSIVHGNSLFIMPLYFICLITIALIINNILLKNHNTKKYAK